MTVTIEIFTSPTCPHCPPAKKLALQVAKERADDNVKVVETSIMTKEGSEKAQSLGVFGVPAIFVKGPKFDRMGFRGLPPKQKLLDSIDIGLGKKEWKESKSLLQSIKEKLPKVKW